MLDKTHQFVARAREVHGEKYDYTKTVYVHSTQKVIITCAVHGDFRVTPNGHLSSKQGCQRCSKRHHYTQEEFIREATKIHNGKYDYSDVVYVNTKTKISIRCPMHGVFTQLPATHTRPGSLGGCVKCANTTKGAYHQKDTNWFVATAQSIHGDKYDYSIVQYQRYHDKVEIVCPEHGPFSQTAGSHIHHKHGCPTCSVKEYEGGYNMRRFTSHPEIKNNPAILYVIAAHNNDEQFIKVGITQKTVSERFEVNNRLPYEYEVVSTRSGNLYDLFVIEQSTIKQLRTQKYTPAMRFNGYTECFHTTSLNALLELIHK